MDKNRIDSIKSLFDKSSRTFFITSFSLIILFSLLLFNLKVSEGADDSSYIFGAWKFIKGDTFPQWHGSFYQILLGLVIFIFGNELLILKLTSFVFVLIYFLWMYRTFKNKVPAYVLFTTLFIVAINSKILVYASLTYSEALYMALQIACIYVFFELVKKVENGQALMQLWKDWLLFGFLVFALYLTRSIGIAMLITGILYFIIFKKPKATVFIIVPFLVFYILFNLYKTIFWNVASSDNQTEVFYLKDPYNPASGYEDLYGFLIRFLKNTYQYLYEQIFAITGINIGDPNLLNLFYAFVFVSVIVVALIVFMRSNKLFAFIGIYLAIAFCATFIMVHSFWNQQRLIMIYYPFIVLILLFTLDKLVLKRKSFLKSLPLITGGLIFLIVLFSSIKDIKENVSVLAKNISGDKYYGYSKGWDNYLILSEWCGNNLENTDTVGCRNPTMSFIYSNGREYRGIYNFQETPSDSFIFLAKKMHKPLIISIKELQSDTILPEEKLFIRKNIWGLMMTPDISLGVINANDSILNQLLKIINKYDLSYTFDTQNLVHLSSYGQILAVIPDNLINTLKKQNINYLLDGKIGTGFMIDNKEMYVNTIKRYVFFIKEKYPNLFEMVKTQGETYPATLYKIHWEKI